MNWNFLRILCWRKEKIETLSPATGRNHLPGRNFIRCGQFLCPPCSGHQSEGNARSVMEGTRSWLLSYAHLSSLPKLKPHLRILKRLYGRVEVTFAIVSSSGRITLNKYHFSNFLYYPISFLVYWERVAQACALKTPVIISELSAQS